MEEKIGSCTSVDGTNDLFFVNQKHLIGIGGIEYYLKEVLYKIVLLGFLTYTNLNLLIPYLFKRKRYFLYIISILVVISIWVFVKNYQDLYYFKKLLAIPDYTYYSSTLPNVSNAILFLCFGVALKLSKQYYLQEKKMHKIEIEKLDTELKYLKAQINPHSVFNSINSVFSLIEKSNTNARAALAKFSEILRYQLYDCGMDKIDITKELNYLSNFIELQKLRKGTDVIVDYQVSDKVKDFKIAPLLIAPFVENAFKYVSAFDEKENKIQISLDFSYNYFVLKVFNTCEPILHQNHIASSGIGLSNVKRRLELLYPERFDLSINQMEESYSVQLKLENNESHLHCCR